MRVATDIGGTFTDLVYFDEGQIRIKKVDTVTGEFERGVFQAIADAGITPDQFDYFAHGSTVVINALTERKGARTALITTKGFRDVLEIGRGNTPDLFNINYQKPRPFVRRKFRKEVIERTNYRGEIESPLDLDNLASVVSDLKAEGIETVAICFLHAYANSLNEERAAEYIRREWPEVAVVLSSAICREWREYERTSTTVLSAYVSPAVTRYLDGLAAQLVGLDSRNGPFIMQSNGGVGTIGIAKSNPVALVESGPASGMLGAAALGTIIGESDLLALDIGGTTAKCTVIQNGKPKITTSYAIESSSTSPGYPIRTPVVDLVEIGNGGGSIAWLDVAGSLNVGPTSAGSTPGPVAYNKGGVQPTTTDANILLGRLSHALVGEGSPRNLTKVKDAFEKMGEGMGLDPCTLAHGVVRIANANMVNALKLVSLNRGHDPRELKLIAFGGGGPLHACALARELAVPEVIIPPNASVFSAWGMLMVDIRRDYIRTMVRELTEENLPTIIEEVRVLTINAEKEFSSEGIGMERLVWQISLDARYKGQEHTVNVQIPDFQESLNHLAIVEKFHEMHEREYSFRMDEVEIEIVNIHLVCFGEVDKPELQICSASYEHNPVPIEYRDVYHDDPKIPVRTPVYNRDDLSPGIKITGPAIIEEATTVTVMHEEDQLKVDDFGCLRIRISKS